ncbi:chymotrypsin-2-like [Bradysia coprophila]|uniref:chymotrypsin-2-like n=1 Tax=Bradysia coprophila TaxID=38358 RepID=UPI00187DBF67|nr:chymotrypsin-2-like [Bradysia coprophila]
MLSIVLSFTFCLFIVVTAGSTDLAAAPSIQVVGGNEAVRYQFPYMATLYMHPSNAVCGGSLITTKTILTAAHCIQDVSPGNWTSIVFGSLVLDKYPPDEPDQIIKNATGVLWHPDFSVTSLGVFNDIGLVFFEPVPLGRAIAVVALPTSASNNYLNADVVLTGWGMTSSTTSSPNLHYVYTKVISNTNCQLQTIPFSVQSSHMCTSGTAAGEDVGACAGDSGGPVVTTGANPVQIGVISVGGTCSGNRPTINTRVTSHLTWINANKI